MCREPSDIIIINIAISEHQTWEMFTLRLQPEHKVDKFTYNSVWEYR